MCQHGTEIFGFRALARAILPPVSGSSAAELTMHLLEPIRPLELTLPGPKEALFSGAGMVRIHTKYTR
ncbi:hypothetical protein VTK56DRAFT_8365 [Thermocarpiscus australiensis]